MQEDYIEEDFQDEESSSNRRPFLIAVGVLVTLFILMGACTAFFLFNNRAAERSEQASIIETRNAETLAANAATAIAATETAASAPTNPPQPTTAPTNTPEPATVTPTNTPVVDAEEEEDALTDASGEEGGEGTVEAGEGTAVSDSGAIITEGDATAEGSAAGEDATPTPMSALSDTSDGTDNALPQTGLDTWGVVVAAFALVGLLIFIRRLRTAG